jgi:hypothetical protein
MSDETKVPETEEQKNIDNQTEQQTGTEERTVPLAALTSERKKWQKQIEEYKAERERLAEKAQIADELASMSGKDMNTLKAELNKMKAQRQYHQPQPSYTPTFDESKVKSLEEKVENLVMETEFEKFVKTTPLEFDQDMKDDVMQYAKSHGLSVDEAAFARYGKLMLDSKSKTDAKNSRTGGANAVLSSTTSGGSYVPTGKVDISDLQRQFAQEVKMDENKYAILSSDDQEAVRKLYQKK